jgi:hypothetical protein
MAANNYKQLALNKPHDCKNEMSFYFPAMYSIYEFLQKMNFPQLLKDVSYWQGIKLRFVVYGQGHDFNWHRRTIDFPCNFISYNICTAAKHVHEQFIHETAYYYPTTPLVEAMYVNFGML